MWELFSTTLLVEVKVVILKYGSPLHFLKSSVRSKRSPRSLARLAGPGRAKGVGVRTCVNGPLKSGSSPCESAILVGQDYISNLSATPKRIQLS
jgi:hypothetical protein